MLARYFALLGVCVDWYDDSLLNWRPKEDVVVLAALDDGVDVAVDAVVDRIAVGVQRLVLS